MKGSDDRKIVELHLLAELEANVPEQDLIVGIVGDPACRQD